MNICVFCSSGDGINPIYKETAYQMGLMLAERGHTIIHGGGTQGLMGQLIRGAAIRKGRVIGVVSDEVRKVEEHTNEFQEVIATPSLSARKSTMMLLSSAYLIMPGGFGTLDEACEVITRKQLGLLKNPISFININNYWSSFFAFIANAEKEKMIVTANRDTFRIYKSVEHYFAEADD